MDDTNAHALYQRACSFAQLGAEEQAIYDLEQSIKASTSIRELAAEESDFEQLKGSPQFESLMAATD